MKRLILWLGIGLSLASCGGGGSVAIDWSQSEHAQGSLPDGAEVISQSLFESYTKDPTFYYLSPKKSEIDAAVLTKQRVEDLELVTKYADENPGALELNPQPDPEDTGLTLLPDGNYKFQIYNNAQETQTIQTMGQQAYISEIAHALRTYPTLQNQQNIYQGIYDNLSAEEHKEFSLITPTEFKDLDAVKAQNYNNQSIGRLQSYLFNKDLTIPKEILFSEIYAGKQGPNIGDGTVKRADCAFSDTGLMKNFDFPLRNHLSTVKNQANRGTCGAFAGVAAMETLAHLQTNKFYNYSEQHLYYTYKNIWYSEPGGDGIYPLSMVEKMSQNRYALQPEYAWNYNPSWMRQTDLSQSCTSYDEYCSNTAHQGKPFCFPIFNQYICGSLGQTTPTPITRYYPTQYVELWNFTNKDTALALGAINLIFKHPIVAMFNVRTGFDNQSGGFVTNTSNMGYRGNHIVEMVGFISREQVNNFNAAHPAGPQLQPTESGGYFIIKNSWGCWGDGGYGYISWDYLKNYGTNLIAIHNVAAN